MRSIRLVAVILAVLVGLASCSRDPAVVKKRYLESGNKYFDKGRYKEASIQYRNALKRDPKYGLAYYKLALVNLKTGEASSAVSALSRAKELLALDATDPKGIKKLPAADRPEEYWDTVTKLADLYLAYGRDGTTQKVLPQFMKDVEAIIKELMDHDKNSFDGHRLTADMDFTKAIDAYQEKHEDEGLKYLDLSLMEYRITESIKPGQQGVWMQLARALTAKARTEMAKKDVASANSYYAEAEAQYRRLIVKDKTFPLAYNELYRLLLMENKPSDAEQLIKLAIANNPKQFTYLTSLARHYIMFQRRDEMLNVLAQIKSHAAEWDQAYLTVGAIYLSMGDGDSAIKEYREGIAKDPKRKVTYQKSIIEVLMRQGKRGEAAEINAQILKDNPKDNDARGLTAQLMLERGEIAKALGELQAVVTTAPSNPIERYNLGRAHAAMGEVELARQQFAKAIELSPTYMPPRLAMAQLQMSRGEFDAAIKTAEEILKIDPGNGGAHLIRSAGLMGNHKLPEARTLLDGMAKSNPSSPDVAFQLGLLNLTEKKYKDADESFRRAYQLNPANPRGLLGVVENYLAQNKPDEAMKILQTESDKAPDRMDLKMLLANTAARLGKFDQSIEVYTVVLAKAQKGLEQADIYLRIGEAYRRKGELDKAIQAMQKARENAPGNVVVLSELAIVLDAASRKPEAKQVYEAALKLDPNNAVVLNNLAFLLAETGGDYDDALTKAQRAKQISPALHEISDTLGWIYLKKSRPEDAIDVFKELVAKEPHVSTYRFHLGMAYKQKGDKTKALEQLKEALKLSPAQEEKGKIQQLINDLG